MTFETLAGPIQARVNGSLVKLELTPPKDLRLNQEIELEGKILNFDFLNTGVPHALIWVEDLEKTDLVGMGPLIRYHDYFKPAGTNVNFVQIKDAGNLCGAHL